MSPTLRERLLLVWIVAFTALVVYALWQNGERVDDIDRERVASCKQTYEGVREVFTPFFEPPPRSPQRQDDIDLFNLTVDDLKAGCAKQTQTQEDP